MERAVVGYRRSSTSDHTCGREQSPSKASKLLESRRHEWQANASSARCSSCVLAVAGLDIRYDHLDKRGSQHAGVQQKVGQAILSQGAH